MGPNNLELLLKRQLIEQPDRVKLFYTAQFTYLLGTELFMSASTQTFGTK